MLGKVMGMSLAKDRLMQVIMVLPDEAMPEIERAVSQAVHDPIAKAIMEAREDDEPLTADDEAALALAEIEIRAGKTRPLSDVLGD